MASRILGLFRDILMFAALGTGPLNSAFILAFTLPNLFRRLLGEGALTSSSIPILTETLERRGKEETFALFNAILTRLGTGLLLLTLLAIPVFQWLGKMEGLPGRWYLGADLSRILFPYVMFVCAGALVCGLLNVFGRFGLAAFNQVWLNVAMIASLLGGLWYLPFDSTQRVYLLSFGVLLGGILQLLVPGYGLRRQGWQVRLNFRKHPDLNKVLKLFLPGLLGAAIFQINILVSRMLAFSLDDTATGLLYLSSRMVELPLGVFAIAVTTVIFPELARMNTLGDNDGFTTTLSRGLGMIFTITLPAAVGLAILSMPILGFLFQWGLFDNYDVLAAGPVLVAAAMGLPFFAWSTLLTRAWYSRQSMAVPVRLAMVNLVLNLILGLVFMRMWGATGLAVANTVSGAVHSLALHVLLMRRSDWIPNLKEVAKLLLALLLLSASAYACARGVETFSLPEKVTQLAILVTGIPVATSLYFASLWMMNFRPVREFSGN